MYQVIKKLVRPSTDVAWPKYADLADPTHLDYFDKNFSQPGKHIFRNNEENPNGLDRTLTVLWESKEAYDEFMADTTMQKMAAHLAEIYAGLGITQELVSESSI